MTDLFGDPEPPPKRGGIGYLAWLAELEYPEGHRFWTLAVRPPHLPPELEMVWILDRDGELHRVAINITDHGIILTNSGDGDG